MLIDRSIAAADPLTFLQEEDEEEAICISARKRKAEEGASPS